MRADRLVSILMLLETKGMITAKELAEELEVTERTIYRDIDSLCMAGIPIIGASGRQGGYSLMEGYSTGLKGLSKHEMLALLSISIPEHFEQTEIGSKLRSSILKLRSTYSQVTGQEAVQSRLYIDMSGWKKSEEASSLFNALYASIYNNHEIKLIYTRPHYAIAEACKLVQPFGLVSKENLWYFVYKEQEKVQVLKMTDIIMIEETGEQFTYPKAFSLEEFWTEWCQTVQEQNSSFMVKVQIHQYLRTKVLSYLEKGTVPLTSIPQKQDDQEWVEIELQFNSFEEARGKLLAFGGGIKVLEPMALRYSIIDYAEQVQNLYKQ